MKRLFVFLLFFSTNSYSQLHESIPDYSTHFFNSDLSKDGPLSSEKVRELIATMKVANKYVLPKTELADGTFKNYQLAYKYSKVDKQDSVDYYFTRTNPYHILSVLDETKSELDTLMKQMNISPISAKAYKTKFNTIYSKNRSVTYDTLSGFYFEVKALMKEMDTANYLLRPFIEKALTKADSIHSVYLRAYIKQNGWPTLEHGSWFATRLAGRDIEYYHMYLPAILNAIKNKQAPVFLSRRIAQNSAYYYSYMYVKEGFKKEHSCFDVTAFRHMYKESFLTSQSLTKNIFDAISTDCDILDFYYVLYTKNLKKEHDMLENFEGELATWSIWDRIETTCPKIRDSYAGYSKESTSLPPYIHLPNYIYTTDREFFCIVYR